MCKTHNHQWKICISNQKPGYIPMEPYLQWYCQRHIQEYIGWNMNQHKPGKSTTGMMLLSLLRVQVNNILPKWYEETTGLCFDRPEDGDLHTPSQPTCSHGWRYQARHYCAHANGFACLFRLKAPPFTSQLKLLHPCLSFWETNYENALQQVLCKLWFVYYLYSSKSSGKYWFFNFSKETQWNENF